MTNDFEVNGLGPVEAWVNKHALKILALFGAVMAIIAGVTVFVLLDEQKRFAGVERAGPCRSEGIENDECRRQARLIFAACSHQPKRCATVYGIKVILKPVDREGFVVKTRPPGSGSTEGQTAQTSPDTTSPSPTAPDGSDPSPGGGVGGNGGNGGGGGGGGQSPITTPTPGNPASGVTAPSGTSNGGGSTSTTPTRPSPVDQVVDTVQDTVDQAQDTVDQTTDAVGGVVDGIVGK